MVKKKADIDTEKIIDTAIEEKSEKYIKKDKKKHRLYDLNLKQIDRDLSPEQQREWDSIYASFRSKSALRGRVFGIDRHVIEVCDPITNEKEIKDILCLVVMDFRVKVIIPETEIWFDAESSLPRYAVQNMPGCYVDYVITDVDRLGECAVASRRMASQAKRNKFFKTDHNRQGAIVDCNVLVVGPNQMFVECNGIDTVLMPKDITYASVIDLRDDYKPGQELKAKIMSFDKEARSLEISIKEANPNPFDGAINRHPAGSRRTGIISGKYAGGLFCRLHDDTNVLCSYNPGMFSEEFYLGDEVVIVVSGFDFERKHVHGKILTKW